MNVENAIEQTVSLAKTFLFDKDGHPKGFNHYLAHLTLTTVIRSPSELTPARSPGCYVEFEWEGSPFVYDLGIAEILLEKANGGSIAEDRILCNAAAILLSATKGISDSRLRNYASRRLSGDIQSSPKRGRGRSATDNSLRDVVIAGRLIPNLLPLGFHATRNDATEGECACSIVSDALGRVGISLSERRIAEIWGSYSHLFPRGVANKSLI
jgi:hypothetical protein